MKKKTVDKSRNKIKVLDWKKYKPEDCGSISDSFYIKLSSKIYKVLLPFSSDADDWNKERIKELSIVASSYLEDIVSDLGIFKSFRDKHKELYASMLPFYASEDDYAEDTINYSDIRFLVWYIASLHIFGEALLFPSGGNITVLTDIIYDILEEAYSDAPINTAYTEIFDSLENVEPAVLRSVCFKIAKSNYLYGPDIISRFQSYIDENRDYIEDNIEYASQYAYLFEVLFSFKVRSHLLSMDIFEIAGRLAMHHRKNDMGIFSIDPESFIFSLFEILSIGDEYIEAKHVSTGAVIRIVKKSFSTVEFLKPNEKSLFGVVKKDEDWYFCGLSISGVSYQDVEYNGYESHIFNDYMRQETEDISQKMMDFFVEQYKGHMLFLNPQEAQKIPDDFYRAYNKKIALEKNTDYNENRQPFRDGGEKLKFSDTDSVTVYFNPKSSFEFYVGIAEGLAMDNNPFFEVLDAECLVQLVCNDIYSTEFYNEVIDFFFEKDALKDIKRYNEFSRNEYDFLKRFYSSDTYKTKSGLALMNVNGRS